MWRSRFNGDRSILDRSITVNDGPVTIVGVMPAGFRFPMVADLWLPLSARTAYGEDRNAGAPGDCGALSLRILIVRVTGSATTRAA